MAVTKDILRMSLDYAQKSNACRIVQVTLRVGALCDFVEEFVQRYFDYLSAGTIAEGAIIKIITIPVMVECAACKHEFKVLIENLACYTCPECGCEQGRLIAGRETFIDEIEVAK